MVSYANEMLDSNPKDKAFKATIHANLMWIESLLGIGMYNPYAYFQLGVSETEKAEIEALIEERTLAKKSKDFAKADEIRTILESKSIQLMDTANGTQWERLTRCKTSVVLKRFLPFLKIIFPTFISNFGYGTFQWWYCIFCVSCETSFR